MTDTQPQPWRGPEFDGLVVESANGHRILALPVAVLEALRYASVIRYRRSGTVFNLSVDNFGCTQETRAQDDVAEAVRQAQTNAANAAGSKASWPAPSPTTPPVREVREDDPADIPIYVKRGGAWTVRHVTRAEYQRYQDQGRLTQEEPGVPELDETEGTDQ